MDQPSFAMQDESCRVPTTDLEMRDPRAAELEAQRWVVVEQHGIRQSWCPPDQVERSISLFAFLLVLAGLAFAFVVVLAGGAIALWRRARAKPR